MNIIVIPTGKIFTVEQSHYRYKKGKFVTIMYNWSDQKKTLAMLHVKGSFPGMLPVKTIMVVPVNDAIKAGKPVSAIFTAIIHCKCGIPATGLQ